MLAAGMMLGGRPRYTVTLTANRGEWRRSIDAAYIPTSLAVELTLVVNPNIEIQSSSAAVGALHFDALAAGSQVNVVNYGYVLGAGGAGNGSGAGGAGGPAVRADFSGLLVLTNASGYLWGGGGGGGAGGMCAIWAPGDNAYEPHLSGGGGGGGAGGGSGSGLGSSGTTGRLGFAGVGGAGGDGSAGVGGLGGTWGAVGGAGASGVRHGGGGLNGTVFVAGKAGGAGGYAVQHNAGTAITWLSGASRIAGSVGT